MIATEMYKRLVKQAGGEPTYYNQGKSMSKLTYILDPRYHREHLYHNRDAAKVTYYLER